MYGILVSDTPDTARDVTVTSVIGKVLACPSCSCVEVLDYAFTRIASTMSTEPLLGFTPRAWPLPRTDSGPLTLNSPQTRQIQAAKQGLLPSRHATRVHAS